MPLNPLLQQENYLPKHSSLRDGGRDEGHVLPLVHKIRVIGTQQRVVWHRWVATPPQHTGTVNLRVQQLFLAGQQRGKHLEALSSEIG